MGRATGSQTAWAGERLLARLTGEWLLLQEGAVSAEFSDPDAIAITELQVQDVDHALVSVSVNANAIPGSYDLSLNLASDSHIFPSALIIGDPADRPQLASITPDTLEQGSTTTLQLQVIGELSTLPKVDLGEGIVVESLSQDGQILSIHIVVDPDAALGERDVLIDDGVRYFEGVSVTVIDKKVPPSNNCATPLPFSWVAGLGALAVFRRKNQCG
jgi:hypothetical protein